MSLVDGLRIVLYVLVGLGGLGLFGLSAFGSFRFPPLHYERVFTLRERLQFASFGLLLVAVAWFQIADLV